LAEPYALPANNGVQIFLPMRLALDPFASDETSSLKLFRVLALQQAGRARRRAASACLPTGDADMDVLVRDLFYLSEALTVDHTLAADFPGLIPDLMVLHQTGLRERPRERLLNLPEREVEALYCQILGTHPAQIPPPFILAPAPRDSLDWALARSLAIRRQILPQPSAETATRKTPYRGIRKGLWLGRTLPLVTAKREQVNSAPSEDASGPSPAPRRQAKLTRRPDVREKKQDEDDPTQGMWMLQMDDPQQHVEDPGGMQRPTDREDNAGAGELADSLSELPEARLISTPQVTREILLSDDIPIQGAMLSPSAEVAAGIAYPEWDYRIQDYLERGAIVRLQVPILGDNNWAESVLAKRRTLLREIQRRFEGMRPRRIRQHQQPHGDDVDINAYVSAFAERRAGLPLDDRLYQSVRPARRDIAIALLIDISASTDGWVSHDLRIIDVEKEALLLVYHALSALGDPFCIHAFSGESAQNVSLWALKGFDERNACLVQRRIAALEPQCYTRAGAALRHAAASLAACPAQHHLLILLSDGKPNDVDHYEGRYGVEDMRQAVTEAKLQLIHPFCITVDRHAPNISPAYLAGDATRCCSTPNSSRSSSWIF
jgi:nitric oxide reductase NorD protein